MGRASASEAEGHQFNADRGLSQLGESGETRVGAGSLAFPGVGSSAACTAEGRGFDSQPADKWRRPGRSCGGAPRPGSPSWQVGGTHRALAKLASRWILAPEIPRSSRGRPASETTSVHLQAMKPAWRRSRVERITRITQREGFAALALCGAPVRHTLLLRRVRSFVRFLLCIPSECLRGLNAAHGLALRR